MDVSHLLNDLNDAQREAVTAPPSNQLILAGAGSGKTRVLVHRIAWLVQVENISPHAILAVTFTNKAAREMRGRIEPLLSDRLVNMHSLWVGTFHGIAHRLLKRHWQEAGLEQNFQIMDSDDQLRLLKRVCQSLQLDENRWSPRQAQWYINAQKDEGLRPQHIRPCGDIYDDTLLRIYTAYEALCRQGGLVDFGELLLRAHELFLNNQEILHHYQQHLPYILVDEFQDTNTLQYAWLRVLAGTGGKLTAVGDDDQSIYGWRGAKIENIQLFTQHFAQTQTIRLEQNYRSSEKILEAANSVIANNSGRLGKNLWTDRDRGEPIDLYAAFNEFDEARFVITAIKTWVKQGRPYQQCAILYRSNAQSRVLEEALLREAIAYRIYGGQRFYDRLEIKNALAYLRLSINRNDDTAFERIINTPTRGIGLKTVDNIRLFAREQGSSLWEAAVNMTQNQALPARAVTAVAGFLQLIAKVEQAMANQPLAEQVEIMFAATKLLDFHKNEKGEKGQTRFENLQELVSACRSFDPNDTATPPDDDRQERSDLSVFLDNASLDAGDNQADEFDDAVQLMTLHSAKGLEFPCVFLVGMEEHLFPHKMSAEDPERLQEERRLCYVGITRAMEKLTFSFAEARRLHGKETFNRVSRFIKEVPEHCINEIRLKTEVKRPVNYARANTRRSASTQDGHSDTGFYLGQRVVHKLFGEGVILHFEGEGAAARVQVNFDSQGSKWLVIQYANLSAQTQDDGK
ncbi:MAG: DNA helicase II [Cellvibrionaceae bacterium]|nr:DNA helicase II [Cellvibrionaceae bacterium]